MVGEELGGRGEGMVGELGMVMRLLTGVGGTDRSWMGARVVRWMGMLLT